MPMDDGPRRRTRRTPARTPARHRAARPGHRQIEPTLRGVARASDFAIDTLLRQPALARCVGVRRCARCRRSSCRAESRTDWPAMLRRYRTAESTRLIWRDVAGLDDVDATLAGSTRLAETCLQSALAALEGEFAERFGVVRATDGSVQRLVVFGLGKLGGGELNFSSDVDLVYAYPQDGESDGAACARGRRPFRATGPATREAAGRSDGGRVLPSRRPAPAALRQRRARGAAVRGDGVSTSSAKAATGNATPGRRRGRSRATSPRACASSKPCGPSSIAAISITARSTACAK